MVTQPVEATLTFNSKPPSFIACDIPPPCKHLLIAEPSVINSVTNLLSLLLFYLDKVNTCLVFSILLVIWMPISILIFTLCLNRFIQN